MISIFLFFNLLLAGALIVKQEADLVDVDGCDSSRVTLQGEEAARILQTVNLKQQTEEEMVFPVLLLRKNLEDVLTRTVWSWLPVTTLPAATRSTVMGFWCAHCTERVS